MCVCRTRLPNSDHVLASPLLICTHSARRAVVVVVVVAVAGDSSLISFPSSSFLFVLPALGYTVTTRSKHERIHESNKAVSSPPGYEMKMKMKMMMTISLGPRTW